MKIKLLVLMCTLMVLAGCDDKGLSNYRQAEKERVFFKCLEKIPKGPVKTHYNDWGDVVDSCNHFATYSTYNLEPVGAAK